ncbi:MAG: 28S ribosomal protein S10, mitochondrial [Vezdaea aestivalis]|nr:MAG: 28S ribosomal protein S10, mitochondrial [Vezdaea aestivalis]
MTPGHLQSIKRAPELCRLHVRQYSCLTSGLHSQVAHASTATAAWPSNDRVIFSGIQPTGVPHIGNYLGALKPWVNLQNGADTGTLILYCIVDLHALTIRKPSELLRRWKRETLATLLSTGIDPQRSCIFFQSDVPAHSEMMWLLSCCSSMGQLSRMTQWKTKLKRSSTEIDSLDSTMKSKLQLGLFSYPVLQAADILLYRSTEVPIGDDQSQHLEFTRSCANTFNHNYGTKFPLPTTILSNVQRVMSLTQPKQKMSKSDDNPASRILLTDSIETIDKKIKHALTDSNTGVSYDPEERPGVSNLISIMANLNDPVLSAEAVVDRFSQSSLRQFKEAVADCINEELSPLRQQYSRLIAAEQGQLLDDIAAEGALTARKQAAQTMDLVRSAVGIRG